MENRPDEDRHGRRLRVRRWAREIVLALLLTVAAAAFIATALLRGDGANHAPAFETARTPPPP